MSRNSKANGAPLLPPHDDRAEAGALACILAPTAADPYGVDRLRQFCLDDFYDARHRLIFSTLQNLNRDQYPPDYEHLIQRLKDSGRIDDAGGWEYLARLPDQTPSPENLPTFAETIRDRATRRAVIHDAAEITLLARDPMVAGDKIAWAARTFAESYTRYGLKSGLTGFHPDELINMSFETADCILADRVLASGQSLVIAGAGSLGKSRLLLQLAVSVIAGRPFVGLETHNPGLRWLVIQAENSSRRLRTDFINLQRWLGADSEEWARVNDQLLIHGLENDADYLLALDSAKSQDAIAELINRARADVVCWDSLYNFAAGDLNKDEDMAQTLLTISRLTKAGNPQAAPVVLHHALTGKAGAARATGYDRSSHGRNSKVLFAWARAQINLAPASGENNDSIILSCAKCSNGKEFAPICVKLNEQNMIYEPVHNFDFQTWSEDIKTKRAGIRGPAIEPNEVAALCAGAPNRKTLARLIMDDCGCTRESAYRVIRKCEKSGAILYSKPYDRYDPP